MKMTPSEIYFCNDFANKISKGKIDNKDFYDTRNAKRSEFKVHEDNMRGKMAELNVCNILGGVNVSSEMDFNIYKAGIGDNFDIIANGKSVDVKASSPNARSIMVEESKMRAWNSTGVYPDYLCMVVVKKVDNDWITEYKFGISWADFRKNSKWYKRGDNIPNTCVPLKANNAIVTMDKCDDVQGMLDFIQRTTKTDSKQKGK